MARPRKIGVNYFPHDTDMHDNFNLRRMMSYHGGGNAYAVFNVILEFIYKSGYYINVDKYLIFNISNFLRNGDDYSENFIQEVIKGAVENDLFDKYFFSNNNVLTSYSIQKRYITIAFQTHRTISQNEPYLMDEIKKEFKINSDKTTVKSDNTKVMSDETTVTDDTTVTDSTKVMSDKTTVMSDNTKDMSDKTMIKSEFSTQIKEKESKDNNSLRSSLSPSTPPTPAHVREYEEFKNDDKQYDDPLTAAEGVEVLKNDRSWLLQMQIKFAIYVSEIVRWLDKFVLDCDCRDKQQHENLADVKQHFNDWLPKMLNSNNGGKKGRKKEAVSYTPEQRWIQCQAELCQATREDIADNTFKTMVFESFDGSTSSLILQIPNKGVREYVESNLMDVYKDRLRKHFGNSVKLNYRVVS